MQIASVFAAGYRSLRSIRFPVGNLTVLVGENGAGKTNLYRALELLQAAATGTLARELASEGGMESVLWAGPRKAREPVRIKLGVTLSAGAETDAGEAPEFGYEIEIGIRMPTAAAFPLEPQVKEERLFQTSLRRRIAVLDRRGPSATALDHEGRRQPIGADLLASETALGAVRDPGRFPDLDQLRRTLLDWRFYHDLRTDRGSPLRRPCLAVTTPTLASDGSDLAAVLATLAHIREDTADLDQTIEDAFPGARLAIPLPERSASFGLVLPDYPMRVFAAEELSDGTLRYLALAGALLGYRLPGFIALNEPEASLHPELLDPLARLIVRAARRAQIWVVTHSERLATAVAEIGGITPRRVIKRDGETWIEGLKLVGEFQEDED
jgi:predicted ATPase